MRSWPLAIAAIVGAMLLMPAGASAARTKAAKVRASGEGGVTLASFELTVRMPRGARAPAPRARVRNARRLRGNKVITSIGRLGGNRFQVTILVINPRGGTTARSAGGVVADVRIGARGNLTAAQSLAARDVINSQGLAAAATAAQFCESRRRRAGLAGQLVAVGFTKKQARGIVRDLVAYLCQSADVLQARLDLLRQRLGLPSCSGRLSRFGDSRKELVAKIQCAREMLRLRLRAQTGNPGANCLPPAGGSCNFGQACGELEDVCFTSQSGFPARTSLDLNAAWQNDVASSANALDVKGTAIFQGGAREQRVYLYRPAELR